MVNYKNLNKCRYIVVEGVDGVGKSTQTSKLVEYLRSKGYRVLQTKEPGTPHSPITMTLRSIMLDNKHDLELTKTARELISQAIRSIHLERVVVPAMSNYDFIIQDRGLLTGYAYGYACGNSMSHLEKLSHLVMEGASLPTNIEQMYDLVIYLKGDPKKGLHKAISSKKEFEMGDAMEARGEAFLERVSSYMDLLSDNFNTIKFDVDDRSIDEVHDAIVSAINA